jgi:hypothetical protein
MTSKIQFFLNSDQTSESGRTSFRLIMPMATTEISDHD